MNRVAVVLLCALVGCAAPQPKEPQQPTLAARVKMLQPGTSKEKIIEILGPPKTDAVNKDGRGTLTYEGAAPKPAPDAVGTQQGNLCVLDLLDNKLQHASCLSDIFGSH